MHIQPTRFEGTERSSVTIPVDPMLAVEATRFARSAAKTSPAPPSADQVLRRINCWAPTLLGLAALGVSVRGATAAFAVRGTPDTAVTAAVRYFSSADGSVQGEVIAPWNAVIEGSANATAGTVCDNFLGVVMDACNLVNTTVRGFDGPGARMPAFFEPLWFVHVNVNMYNLTNFLSATVQCLFNIGNYPYQGS